MTCRIVALLIALLLLGPALARPAEPVRPSDARPDAVGLDPDCLFRIDKVANTAIAEGRTPGAVVLVLRDGRVAYRKAFGQRQVQPSAEAMTADTVFDLASLTKPVATATSVLLMIERGQLRLADPVSTHLSVFDRDDKRAITLEQLLLHTSGLPSGNPVADYEGGIDKAIQKIASIRLSAAPGERFRYSDLGFIVLGEVVRKVAGEPLDAFARKNVFAPLGMRDTTFRPGSDLAARAATTEKAGERWLRGEVHDPRARKLGGVAGHAGLFGTADDLALYAQMLLDGGIYQGKRILSPAAVRLMTAPRRVPGGLRALGWDVQTAYSSNRGELFGGFGHTGFTGTSLWIDPPSRTAVVFLSNRVHPAGKGNVTRLRSQVATLAAAAIVEPPYPDGRTGPAEEGDRSQVRTGIDVLAGEGFKRLSGRRVGLVTNHTGLDRSGASSIDLLAKAPGVKLVALFSPEHGIRGEADSLVADGKDTRTGLPIYSLYGKNRRPTAEQLAGIDTLVYDIQDIGCRFYSYLTTLGYLLETAAAHKLRLVVLDRPNPIGGLAVEGPLLDRRRESFVGYHPLPVRHGMTLGELASLFNKERKIGADLEVVRVEGWRRGQLFDRTDLVWVNPSPNMRSLAAALLYPGIGLLETTNVSVGRGTDRPFELLGAPWLDGRRLADELAGAGLRGVRFVPARFTPSSSTHAKKACGGVQIYLDDWSRFESLPVGLAVAASLRKLYPKEWQVERYNVLLGNAEVHRALRDGESAARLLLRGAAGLKAFREVRRRYLLYR
jgi:uncharacterized protein YbbC (DUF1343 family)/CubicO group peptidase (beta-lactamase class C family)